MFGATELIVGLWLVPVTLFILIPLVMLCTWSVIRLIKTLFVVKEPKKQTEEALEGHAY